MPDLELLDCGGGRRLERFGPVIVDRPAPAADWIPRLPRDEWNRAGLRWEKGGWVRTGRDRGAAIEPWTVRAGALAMECRPAAGGQLGVFPEHVATWAWLDRACRAAAEALARPPEVLSLFAYTGGATLACARAGAQVVHVDASRPAVAWARRNAELSGLDAAPIRWLVEDARAFVRRERRRGRHYDGLVLDPPSYGHGSGAWQIDEHLRPLLEDLAALAGPRPSFVLLSAHTQGFDGDHLAGLVREHFGIAAVGDALTVDSRAGSRLPLGAWGRGPEREATRKKARPS
jgi:23S rRNA (cytosine1962-C5)-methyltransferase